jgi:hypothetical protein
MKFGEAIEAVKDGKKVTREAWGDKDAQVHLHPNGALQIKNDGATFSHEDLLAEDWVVVGDPAEKNPSEPYDGSHGGTMFDSAPVDPNPYGEDIAPPVEPAPFFEEPKKGPAV